MGMNKDRPRIEYGHINDPKLGMYIYVNGLPLGGPVSKEDYADAVATWLDENWDFLVEWVTRDNQPEQLPLF